MSLQDIIMQESLLKAQGDFAPTNFEALATGATAQIVKMAEEKKAKKDAKEAEDKRIAQADQIALKNPDKIREISIGPNGRSDKFSTPIKKAGGVSAQDVIDIRNAPLPKDHVINPNYGLGSNTPYIKAGTETTMPNEVELSEFKKVKPPKGFQINPNYGLKAGVNPYIETVGKKYDTIEGLGVDIFQEPELIREQLMQVDPSHAKLLQAYNEGDLKLPGRGSTRQIDLLKDITTLYPNFDQSQFQVRYNTKKSFTSGKASDNIKSLNTAIDHLDSLHKIIPELENTSFRKYNSFDNFLKAETGNPSIAKFKLAKNAVSDELATIFKGSSGTDTGIAQVRDAISAADSPEALNAVVGQAVKLMQGRMGALTAQWDNTFKGESQFPVISPKSQKILDRLGYGSEISIENIQPAVVPEGVDVNDPLGLGRGGF